jgi:signal transduction histidine kinase
LLDGADASVEAIARLLDSAALSVAVFERGPQVTVAYLNAAAAAQAAVAAEAAAGRPVNEVFPQLDPALIEHLLSDTGAPAEPTNLRGMLPGGSAWSVDAIRLGRDRVLVLAEELGDAVSSRQRLEALLASTNVIWRPIDFGSMAPLIVEQAGRLLSGVDVGLWTISADAPAELRLTASNSPSMKIGFQTPIAGTVAGEAARSGSPVEVTAAEGLGAGKRGLLDGIHTARAVPLTAGGRVLEDRGYPGVLVFAKRLATPFTDAERRLMDEFGKLVALAADRAELLADARHSARRLELTLEVAMALAGSLSPREIIQVLLSRTLETVEADRATLSSMDDHELVIEATHSRSGEVRWVGLRYGLEYLEHQPLISQALRTQQPVFGGAMSTPDAAPEFRAALEQMTQTATLPLFLSGRPAGLLIVSRTADRQFTNADTTTLQLMGNAAMLALRNARLFEELKKASASKTEFLNLAAHELRTPVTVISGYASLLRAGIIERNSTESDKALGVIEQKAGELKKLVDALLLAARLQTGSPVTKRRVLDIVESVRLAASRAKAFAGLKGGTVGSQLPDAPILVVADGDHLARILDNLLNNAVAYSDGPPQVEARVVPAPGHVWVEVRDRGRGIPASQSEFIFEQFARVEDPNESGTSGAGLGLYIARGLARNMGGELELFSTELGKGSIFRLRLPVPAGNESEGAEAL